MKKVYALYNPYSSNNKGREKVKYLESVLTDCDIIYRDITKIKDYRLFFASLCPEDEVVVSGGDGTLSRFATDIYNLDIKNPICYYATGSGNDFLKDMGKSTNEVFLIDDCVKNTPVATINGREYCFVNGVGGGLDAYACEMGNRLHEQGKKGNYVLSAVKGILYDYKPTKATVCIDGKKYEFGNVWFASVMKGRFFGGGIMLAPDQDRCDGQLSVVIVHTAGRLRILPIIPGAFEGKHIKYTEYVTILKGESVEVSFDRPVSVQIDGETVPEVTEYIAKGKVKQYENA